MFLFICLLPHFICHLCVLERRLYKLWIVLWLLLVRSCNSAYIDCFIQMNCESAIMGAVCTQLPLFLVEKFGLLVQNVNLLCSIHSLHNVKGHFRSVQQTKVLNPLKPRAVTLVPNAHTPAQCTQTATKNQSKLFSMFSKVQPVESQASSQLSWGTLLVHTSQLTKMWIIGRPMIRGIGTQTSHL